MPPHRRRGLAKWVVEERLKSVRAREREMGLSNGTDIGKGRMGDGDVEGDVLGEGMNGYVWVFRGNVESERLWEGLGWKRGWGAQWCFL
jgi:GNAT superfamily N-acetyltransferase